MTLATYATTTNLSALYEAGDYRKALDLIDSTVLPMLQERPDDPALAESALLVANVYRDLAHYSAAEPYYLQALAGLALAGKDRPDYARGLAELALLYEKLGREEQALELCDSACSIHQEATAADAVSHARCLQQMAELLDAVGRRREAIERLQRARGLLESARAEPLAFANLLLDEARVLNRVEGILTAVDRARSALALRLRHSGEAHPATANARSLLGSFLTTLCEFGEAETLLESARETLAAAIGDSHPRYATILESQALLRSAQGNHREAESLARRGLELIRSGLGDRHIWTAESSRTLGQVFQASRQLTAAEESFASAMEIVRERFGEKHSLHADLQLDMAWLRHASGRRAEAMEMVRAALKRLHANDDDVRYELASACLALAQMTFDAGDTEEAERMVGRTLDLAGALGAEPFLWAPALVLRSQLEAEQGNVCAARASLDDAETSLDRFPAHHWLRGDVDATRVSLAGFHGEPERALKLARESVRRAEGTPFLAAALSCLAEQLHQAGEFTEAEASFERLLDLQRKQDGPEHPNVAATVRGLARLHLSRGNFQAAEVRFRKALDIRRIALGDRHPDTAESMADLAWLAQQAGDVIAAEAMYRHALEIRRETLGETHPDTLAALHGLAQALWALGDSAAAADMLEKALGTLEKGHPQGEALRHTLALVCHARGDVARALELLYQVRHAQEKVLGDCHEGLIPILGDLARIHIGLGDHLAARSLLEQMHQIHAQSPYPQPQVVALDLVALSNTYRALCDLDCAGDLADQALALARSSFVPEDPALLGYLTHSAATCRARRLFPRCQRLLDEAGALVQRFGGERHPYMAGLHTEQALLEAARGQTARAISLFASAADMAERSLGPDHPDHANARRVLGLHMQAQGDFAGAATELGRHLAIMRRTAGADHPAVAMALLTLTQVHRQKGDLASAVTECRKALDLIRTSEHPLDGLHAEALHALAMLLRVQGDGTEAEELFAKVLEIDHDSAGAEGNAHLDTLRELAVAEAARGQHAAALARLRRVLAAQDGLVTAFGCLTASAVRDALLGVPWEIFEQVLTLSLRAPGAEADALGLALRWNALPRGDLLVGDRIALRRQHPANAEAIDRLFDLNIQIGCRLMNGAGPEGLPMHHDLLSRWCQERQRWEDELAGTLPSLARLRAWQAVSVDRVRQALPEDGALVELVRFQPRDFIELSLGGKGLLPARYAAFVLDAETLALIDAGPAESLERHGGGATFRAALAPHLGSRRRLIVGHGGLKRSVWSGLAPEVQGLRSGRELTSSLLALPPARGWLRRIAAWFGID